MTKIRPFVAIFSLGSVLALAYTNCSGGLQVASLERSLASSAQSCDEVRIQTYKSTFHPFFRSNCVSCHIEGGTGLGLFASPDVDSSFAAFAAAGVSKIGYMATNPAHKPPFTGAQNQPAIDSMSANWASSERQFLECVSKSENGGVNESLLTSAKTAPAIFAGPTARQTLSWDLDLAGDLDESMTRSIPARISIDVSVLYQTIAGQSLAKGYVFSNPTLQMKDDTKQVVIEGLFFYINKQAITSQTTFTSLSRVVTGTSPMPLMNNVKANTLISPLATQDTFQLYIRRIVLASGSDLAPTPLTPVLNLADRDTGLNTHLKSQTANVFIMRDAGIVRWCLSESPVKPASTQAPCVNSMTGDRIVNGWSLSRPTSFPFSQGDGTKQLYLWVANESLKINDEAALATIQLDMQAPAAPVVGSVSVSDSQVASLSVNHPNEADVTGWCVIEQNSIQSAPQRPSLNDRCWKWTDLNAKPTTVGFKEGGSRDVWVYVRDVAGNISAASNKFTAFNPFGAITFSQLTASVPNPRSVFTSRCLTCHSSASNPGFSKLQLFDYASAVDVASAGVLVSRINNVLSPMPNVNGGLMPQRERDLIRLWTMPEEGNTPLP